MLSVNQICDRGNVIIFKKHGYEIRRENSGKVVAYDKITFKNIYSLMKNF